jgi:hypothetical protein
LGEEEETLDIGREGTRFDFEHCKDFGTSVEFREGSLKVSVDAVRSFLQEVYN